MRIGIHLVLHTEDRQAAETVLSEFASLVPSGEPAVEPYHKGGTSARFAIEIADRDWPDAVLECLRMAQSFGYTWSISGDADSEIILVSSKFAIPGIWWSHVWMHRWENDAPTD